LNPSIKKFRIRLFIALLLVTPLGFATKFYSGPLHAWVHDSMGGVLYEVFWCLAAAVFFPRVNIKKTAALIFTATCVLEILQLWHPPFLEAVRMTFIGRTLIGTSFSWLDFPHYLLGCLAGWRLADRLGR
jgi:hypothetical protein